MLFRSELEEVRQAVFRNFPTLGQVTLGNQAGIDMHETRIDIGCDLELQNLVDLGRIQRDNFGNTSPTSCESAAAMRTG